MGTNFYLNYANTGPFYEGHIGKRSAAGDYCWDCGLTLCVDGEDAIHLGKSEWYDSCPNCGKTHEGPWSLDKGPAARELGFDNSPYTAKTGLGGCSSFTWAMDKQEAQERAEVLLSAGIIPVVDEYGREMDWDEFLEMLVECPVQYYHSIGKEFF